MMVLLLISNVVLIMIGIVLFKELKVQRSQSQEVKTPESDKQNDHDKELQEKLSVAQSVYENEVRNDPERLAAMMEMGQYIDEAKPKKEDYLS